MILSQSKRVKLGEEVKKGFWKEITLEVNLEMQPGTFHPSGLQWASGRHSPQLT